MEILTCADAPAWLNTSLVATALSVPSEKIQTLRVRPALPPGSNFCSSLWRLEVALKDGDRHDIVIKSPPETEPMKRVAREYGFTAREIHFYRETLPALRRIEKLARLCPKDSDPITPETLPCRSPDTLILTDLTTAGFRVAKRQDQLDFAHCCAALTAVARLHALSVALHNADPVSMEAFQEPIYNNAHTKEAQLFASRAYRTLAAAVDSWSETANENLGTRLRALADNAHALLCKAVRSPPGGLRVLNHGDLWVANIMFDYRQEKVPIAARLLDMQVSRFTRPTLDLQYLLYTSANEEVLLNHVEHLLAHYHRELVRFMTAFQVDHLAPSLQALVSDFRATAIFGLHAAITVMCGVVADPDEKPDFDVDITNSEEASPLLKAMHGLRYRRLIPGVLREFVRKGIL